MYSITPPMSRAIENDGVFKNPIANATPDGIHLAIQCPLFAEYVFAPDSKPNRMENMPINTALFSGS
jgi:hypothetical protein